MNYKKSLCPNSINIPWSADEATPGSTPTPGTVPGRLTGPRGAHCDSYLELSANGTPYISTRTPAGLLKPKHPCPVILPGKLNKRGCGMVVSIVHG